MWFSQNGLILTTRPPSPQNGCYLDWVEAYWNCWPWVKGHVDVISISTRPQNRDGVMFLLWFVCNLVSWFYFKFRNLFHENWSIQFIFSINFQELYLTMLYSKAIFSSTWNLPKLALASELGARFCVLRRPDVWPSPLTLVTMATTRAEVTAEWREQQEWILWKRRLVMLTFTKWI